MTEKTSGKPGPKPDFLVVEGTLKCQTSNGELSLPLTIPFRSVRKLAKIEGDQFQEFDFYMENLFTTEDNEALDDLDAAEAVRILTHFGSALAERLTASLGESESSSES